jgi:hypothetical protein
MSLYEDLKAYIDGELDAERAAEIAEALESDRDLRAEHDYLIELGQEIRAVAAEPEVLGYEEAVAAVRKPRWVALLQNAPTFAAAFVLVVLVSAMLFPVFAQPKLASKRTSLATPDAEARSPVPAAAEMIKTQGGGAAENIPAHAGALADAQFGQRLRQSDAAVPERSAPAVTLPNQKIVRNGQISLRVEDVQTAQAKISGIAQTLGGYVEHSSGSNTGSTASATVQLRVPEKRFQEAMEQIRKVEPDAKVMSESMRGEDVTTQYVDVESHVKTLRAEEEQYRLILSKASRIQDIMSVRDRLSDVRREIESLESQRRALAQMAAYSTIGVTLEKKREAAEAQPPQQHWAEKSMDNALALLASAGRRLAVLGIYAFTLAPFWLPFAIAGWYLVRRL